VNPLGLSSEGNDPSIWGTGVKRAIHKFKPGIFWYDEMAFYTQWRQREFKVGEMSLVSRLSACLTEANWWRLIAE